MNNKSLGSISVITNPVKNYLLLKSIKEFSTEFYYSILDLNGNEIVCSVIKQTYGKLIGISVDFLKKGTYLLKVADGDHYIVESFVKV